MQQLARGVSRVLMCLLPLTACDTTATEPEASPVGHYEATTLSFVDDGETFDIIELDAAAYVELELKADGTTTGHFYVSPNPGEEGSGMNVSLDGTWTMAGDKVTLQHPTDSALRDIEYTFAGNALSGSGQVGHDTADPDGIFLTVVLTRE